MNQFANYSSKREMTMQWRKKFFNSSISVGIVCIGVVFGIMYIVQMNSISTRGYEMSDLENQITLLEQENQKLEFQIASNKSMKSIQSRLVGKVFVAADTYQYGSLVGTAMAMR